MRNENYMYMQYSPISDFRSSIFRNRNPLFSRFQKHTKRTSCPTSHHFVSFPLPLPLPLQPTGIVVPYLGAGNLGTRRACSDTICLACSEFDDDQRCISIHSWSSQKGNHITQVQHNPSCTKAFNSLINQMFKQISRFI